MGSRKMTIRFDAVRPAMSIFRSKYWSKHLVYVVRADRKTSYPDGRSRIVYIGETKRGNRRAVASAAGVARQTFGFLRGFRQIDVYPLTFRGKQSVKMWEVLEHDLLSMFKYKSGRVPRYNSQGKGKGFAVDRIKYFRRERLKNIIESLS
jgi:hypothetical protein